MKCLTAVALAATLAACTQGADVQPVQLQVTTTLPEGPPVQYRPTKSAPFELRMSGGGQGITLFGTVSIDQLDPNRFRITHTATRSRGGPLRATDTWLSNLVYSRVEVEPSGKYLVIEPPSPERLARSEAAVLSYIFLLAQSRDWANLFEQYETLPVYPAGLTVGTPIMPTTLTELFDKRVELLEAMVRGNTSGFWGDLPHGGTMTKVQRDILTATIRARAMPEVYESDVRIRGSANYNGRAYLFARGTVRRSLRGGGISVATVEQLIDPASGLVVLSRTSGGTGGGGGGTINANTRTADAPFHLLPHVDAAGGAIPRTGRRG